MSPQPPAPTHADKGGRARASVLTADQRKAIARTAALARWTGRPLPAGAEQASDSPGISGKTPKLDDGPIVPVALFPGKLKMAAAEFAVYVLDNGKRVMAQREVVRVLTGKRESGKLASYVNAQVLRPYLDPDNITSQTLQFKIPGTQYVGHGYEATLLLDICDAYLRARDDGVLTGVQLDIAKQAEIITRACAKVGIIALIDEATGYQEFRKKRELQVKLQAFIAEDLQEWALMFPQEFWFELARLEGVHYSPRSRPLRWGKYIMAFVYDAVDGDIGKHLRKINPDPQHGKNHHQWLKEFGRSKVHDQIQRVVTIMKLCDSMDDFKQKFARVFKKSALNPQMSFTWED